MTKLKEAFACHDFEVHTNLQSGKVMGNLFTATTASINQCKVFLISQICGGVLFLFCLFLFVFLTKCTMEVS